MCRYPLVAFALLTLCCWSLSCDSSKRTTEEGQAEVEPEDSEAATPAEEAEDLDDPDQEAPDEPDPGAGLQERVREALEALEGDPETHISWTVEDIAALHEAGITQQIQNLSFADTGLDDDGVQELIASGPFASVTILTVSANNVTDDGIIALLDSDAFPALTRLNFRRNPTGWPAIHAVDQRLGVVEGRSWSNEERNLRYERLREMYQSGEFSPLEEIRSQSIAEIIGLSDEARADGEGEDEDEAEPGEELPALGECPALPAFRGVSVVHDRPMLLHSVHDLPEISEPLVLTEEAARVLGHANLTDPVFVYSNEGGEPCRMEVGSPLLIQEPTWGGRTLAIELHGDCEVQGSGADPRRASLGLQAPELNPECALKVLSDWGWDVETDEQWLQHLLSSQSARELSCEGREGCEVLWKTRRARLTPEAELVQASAIMIVPWPDDDDYHCGSYIVGHSGVDLGVLIGDELHRRVSLGDDGLLFQFSGPTDGIVLVASDLRSQTQIQTFTAAGVPQEARYLHWGLTHPEEIEGPFAGHYCEP